VTYLAVDNEPENGRLRSSSPLSLASSNGQRVKTSPSAADTEAAKSILLEALKSDPEEAGRDISSVLRKGNHLSDKAKARAAAIIRHDMFKSFVEEARYPARLLVNSGEDSSTTDDVSAICIVAAELAQTSPPPETLVFSLSYFCGEHQMSPVIDPSAVKHSSSISMIASLIGQLLTQLSARSLPIDLSFMTKTMLRKISRLEPMALCKAFQELFKQAPPRSVIVCIIDEISTYETQRLIQDTEIVMMKLVKLATRHEDGRPILKLLLTCQDRAMGTLQYFPGCTLDLNEDFEDDSCADWTISTFAKQVAPS
jgi:hypothetical protein